MILLDRSRRWLTPPSFPDARRAQSARILHAAMVTVIGIVTLTIGILVLRSILGGDRFQLVELPILALYVVASAFGLWLLQRGYLRQTGLAYCLANWICVAVGDIVLGHPQVTVVAAFLNVTLLAGFVIAEWAAFSFGLAAMAWVGWTSWLKSIGRLPEPVAMTRPFEVMLVTALPLLCTAILTAYGFRCLRRAMERAEASEQEQACLASRYRTLAELGERIVRIESKPSFASQVAADLQRVTGASAVAVYVPGSTALDCIAAVGTGAPPSLPRALPTLNGEVTMTRVHLLSTVDAGITVPGQLAWTGPLGYATVAVLLTREQPLQAHDQVLLVGCAALLAAALIRLDAEEQLRHSQKMDTVGQLTGVVAHDFNNLLMSIIGGSQLVLHSVKDAELQEILGDIIRAGEQAALLTKRLMSFARRDVLDFQALDLREFARSSGGLIKRLMGPRLELSMPEPGAPVWVRVDRSSVEQIILNLVLNARDATDGCGKVAVSVEADREAGTAVLRVTDNGTGMDEAVRAQIFDPFFTTKPAGKGTGLGLSAVRSAADALGGCVEVVSATGRGSEFRVIFPLAEADGLVEGPADQRIARACAHEVVLLVDDHDIVRRTLAGLLKHAGFEVVEAKDGVDALEQLASGSPPSVIVSDILMPRMSGIELVRALAGCGSRVPIVLLTGYAELHSDAANSLPVGIPILKKPTTAESLTNALRSAIDAAKLRVTQIHTTSDGSFRADRVDMNSSGSLTR